MQLPKGLLTDIPYDPVEYGRLLSRFGSFEVIDVQKLEKIGEDRFGDPLYRLCRWYEIQSSCGDLILAGGFPTLGFAQTVANYFAQLREMYLTPSALEFCESFWKEQEETGDYWGLTKRDAPDWNDAYYGVLS
ncbi:MAG: hypothetical protein CMM42_17555 [Rhodospirillaceae bacterium]|nr:hypothetical protein [Rhodospirillaceae bacterium]|tara:strand:- start:233 stop:631 length:399 start_codon:yes stop_codon:yes gene_type:complete